MNEKTKKFRGWRILILLFSLLGLTLGLAAGYLNTAPDSWTEKKIFTIAPGTAVYRIAEDLENQGFIRSKYLLRFLVLVKGEEKSYQVGSYQFPPGLSALEIQSFLTSGRQLLFKVTIPEGYTAKKTAQVLEEAGITSSKEFLEALKSKTLLEKYGIPADTLDGFLSPDTYLFPKEYPSLSAVDHMVSNFMDKLEAEIGDFRKTLTPREWYNNVILASVVEREYRVVDEAPVIASVFANRLENHIPLGSCASIVYILTEIQNRPHPKRIYFIDTEIDSPYNTYRNQGLPPGPISNPGITALKAAFRPIVSDFLYFVVKDPLKGTHSFSTNYRDHNEARDIYLAGFETKS